MKVSKTIAAAVLAAVLQVPALAIPERDQTVVSGIAKEMFVKSTVSVRGGKSGLKQSEKALGLYSVTPEVVFRSGYEKLPNQTQVEWAYDLHDFVVSKGGGLENYPRYMEEQAERLKRPQLAAYRTFSKELPDPYDPLDRIYVSYADRKKFARDWWEARDEGFKNCFVQDWWLNDAILDGTNLWQRWEMTYLNSADREGIRTAELSALAKQE
ncbi:MAG TPA: hypothetical protein PKA48_05490 [Candidatus Obscuribacter sp.]|jgi:hypothetical protein|nr:hypothetical protein [Candidatus Obscuribacter sp.]HND05195.1 hypothetical protein [Candidatus Obscuribacter sp.]